MTCDGRGLVAKALPTTLDGRGLAAKARRNENVHTLADVPGTSGGPRDMTQLATTSPAATAAHPHAEEAKVTHGRHLVLLPVLLLSWLLFWEHVGAGRAVGSSTPWRPSWDLCHRGAGQLTSKTSDVRPVSPVRNAVRVTAASGLQLCQADLTPPPHIRPGGRTSWLQLVASGLRPATSCTFSRSSALRTPRGKPAQGAFRPRAPACARPSSWRAIQTQRSAQRLRSRLALRPIGPPSITAAPGARIYQSARQ